MSIRNIILSTLSSDLSNIQSSNGYYNSIKFVKNGVLLPEQVTVYPSIGYSIIEDELVGYSTEDLKLEVRKLSISISIYINEENKSLSIENMVNDLNKLFKDDDSIAPQFQSHINLIEGIWNDKQKRCLNVDKISQITEAGIILYQISIFYKYE